MPTTVTQWPPQLTARATMLLKLEIAMHGPLLTAKTQILGWSRVQRAMNAWLTNVQRAADGGLVVEHAGSLSE